MERVPTVLVTALLVTALLTGAVAAQEEADDVDVTENEEEVEEQDGESDTVDDIWTLIRDSDDAERPSEGLITDLGSNLYVTDLEFDEEDGTATITVVARVSTRVTVTDATAFDRSQEVSVAESRGVTIPRGTYELKVPATVRDDENQAVTVAPGDGQIYMLSNGMVSEGYDPLSRLVSLKIALGAIGAFLLGIVLRIGYKVYRKQETGLPESLDGMTLENDRVGVEDDE